MPHADISAEGIVYLALCVVVGIGLITSGIWQRRKVRVSAAWPTAMGAIIKSEIRRPAHTDSRYELAVEYAYLVNGTRYTGKRIEFGQKGYARRKTAEAAIEKYPANSSVIVYFNPEKPEEAVLSRRASTAMIHVAFGIIAVVFAIVIFLFSARR